MKGAGADVIIAPCGPDTGRAVWHVTDETIDKVVAHGFARPLPVHLDIDWEGDSANLAAALVAKAEGAPVFAVQSVMRTRWQACGVHWVGDVTELAESAEKGFGLLASITFSPEYVGLVCVDDSPDMAVLDECARRFDAPGWILAREPSALCSRLVAYPGQWQAVAMTGPRLGWYSGRPEA